MPRDIEGVFLKRFNFGVHDTLDVQKLVEKGNDPVVSATNYADGMLVQLSKEIYGLKSISKVQKSIKVPSTWFEHLKKAAGLKYKESSIDIDFDIDVYALFPEVKGSDPVIKVELR